MNNNGLILLLTTIGNLFSPWITGLLLTYISTMLIDYLTGTFAAIKQNSWSSSRARKGIWCKLGSICTLFVACVVDIFVSIGIQNLNLSNTEINSANLMLPIVLIWYLITECGSILENAQALGASIPPFLQKALRSLEDTIDS